ncbi:MAG: hypothetical protein KGJ07_00265 [Patescibacteria group bacterium]|nr:hypothetical protein [Patescibacteria group bacterium]
MGIKSQYAVAVVNTLNGDSEVTVAAGATTSSTLGCGGTSPTGIFLPSTFISCNITFNVSKNPNGPFVPVTNFDGSSFTVAGAASEFIPLLPAMFNSVLFIQLSFSVAQTSAEVIDFALSPLFQGVHG